MEEYRISITFCGIIAAHLFQSPARASFGSFIPLFISIFLRTDVRVDLLSTYAARTQRSVTCVFRIFPARHSLEDSHRLVFRQLTLHYSPKSIHSSLMPHSIGQTIL